MAKIVSPLLFMVIASICMAAANQKACIGQEFTETELPLDLKMGAPGPIGIEISTHFIKSTKHGVTKQMLRSAVELVLRRNNVPVMEPRLSPLPYLLVEVATLKITGSETYVYNVSVGLYRPAQIMR